VSKTSVPQIILLRTLSSNVGVFVVTVRKTVILLSASKST
jgi:hypothetical protein